MDAGQISGRRLLFHHNNFDYVCLNSKESERQVRSDVMFCSSLFRGRLAQLEERLVYTEKVGGSSPSSPTILS